MSVENRRVLISWVAAATISPVRLSVCVTLNDAGRTYLFLNAAASAAFVELLEEEQGRA